MRMLSLTRNSIENPASNIIQVIELYSQPVGFTGPVLLFDSYAD